jgi:hypothetical protein
MKRIAIVFVVIAACKGGPAGGTRNPADDEKWVFCCR